MKHGMSHGKKGQTGHVGGISQHKAMAGAKSSHMGGKMGGKMKKMGRSMKTRGSRGGY